MVRRFRYLLGQLALFGLVSSAQEPQPWTERRNLGFQGPVRSVLTNVVSPNPDPRPQARRKLMVRANPDWVVFDNQGRRVEFASATSRDGFKTISKCMFRADGTEVCTDTTGRTQETGKEETTPARWTPGSQVLSEFQAGESRGD